MNKSIFLFVALLILTFSACKKDKDDQDVGKNFRLAKVDVVNDHTAYTLNFQYEGDKVKEWRDVDGSGAFYSVIVSYVNDNVVELGYIKDDAGDSVIRSKTVYTFSNNLPEKIEEYSKYNNEDYKLVVKQTYRYDEDKRLTETIMYSYPGEIEKLFYKQNYFYDGDLLAEITDSLWNDSAWEELAKVTWYYHDNLADSLVELSFDNGKWTPMHKDVFFYVNGENGKQVSRIKQYNYDQNENACLFATYTYRYDNYGNPVTMETVYQLGKHNLKTYTYEEKAGNLDKFNFGVWHGHPDPYYKSGIRKGLFPFEKPDVPM